MNLQRYNQRLLAVLGTLVIAALAITLVSVFAVFIYDQFRVYRHDRPAEGVVVDQNRVIDTTAYSFSQEISLLEPYQLDSLKPVFIVPIGQKDQKSRRSKIAVGGLGLESYTEDYYYNNFYGLYNNFVLLDYVRQIKIPVFATKVAITEWAHMKIDSIQLVIFKGTNNDINQDGMLNDDDFQSLFVFNVATRELKELTFENQTVREFDPLLKTSMIYVRTGKDINHDLEFDYSSEPTDLYFYDVATGESETLVPDKIKQEIQQILN